MQNVVVAADTPLRERANALLPALALVALGVGLAALRSSLFDHGLPRFANVDEEIAVGVLQNLEQGPDPQFFHYGSFWFYLLRLLAVLTGAQGPEALMVVGRAANWAMWLLLAPAVYWLATTIGSSRYWAFVVGVVALAAPQAFVSASYVNVDLAATVLTVCAAAFGARYVASPTASDWLGFVVLAGLAVSTKYNAALLVVAFAIVVLFRQQGEQEIAWPRTQLPRWAPGAIFGAAGLAAAAFGLVGEGLLLHVLGGGSDNPGALVEADDIAAIHRVLAAATWGGALLGLIALTSVLSRVGARLRPAVLYMTPLAVCGVAVMGTPFSVLSPREFAYQAGAELALNQGAGDAQWANIVGWTAANVGVPLLLVGGVATLALLSDRRARYVAVLVIVTAIVLGSSHRGFPRYALGLMPGPLALAAAGITVGTQRWARPAIAIPITVLISTAVLVFAVAQAIATPDL